jgi:signal transduction histidine kinase
VLVRSAMERVKRKLPAARFEAAREARDRIVCYPEEMVDAFSQVLQNAVEAQEDSPAPIGVRTARTDSEVIVDIEDAGPGFKRGPRLFEPFFTTKPGHAGLGLYVARLVAMRNGGSLHMSPKEGGGTRVRFSFAHYQLG